VIAIVGRDHVELPEVLMPAAGEVLVQGDGPRRWLAVGAQPDDWAQFGAEVARRVPAGDVGFASQPRAAQLREFVRGWLLGGPRGDSRTLVLSPGAPDLGEPLGTAQAVLDARELGNTPSNTKNPAWMVTQARRVARSAGADIEVLGVRQLAAAGFGGVLAVGQGSASPPRVVVLRRPGKGPRVALIGKGITFDSGGLSLKPRESMALMKTDMAGAAAVLSVLPVAPAETDLTVVLGLAENAFGGGAYRPGDVITHVDGQTSEVRNTDAEGRLVLADLLGYTRSQFSPDVMVDLATLTGAATVALSREYGALYANRSRLSSALAAAGQSSGDQVWPMPLWQGYRHALNSVIADRCHIPTTDVGGGSITAALYLQAFVADVPWAHLDIAGPARSTANAGLRHLGATGFGVALLRRWLADGARF
jgi:leucyl aminopeptidase